MELDRAALRSNLATVSQMCGVNKRFIASIKADAYGHGAAEVSAELEQLGVDMLATGNFSEARQLRQLGIELPVLLFAFAPPRETAQAAAEGYVPTISSHEEAAAVSSLADAPIDIYVKVDCGLGRLGIPMHQAVGTIIDIARLPNIEIRGVYTHVPFGDETGMKWAQHGLDAFAALISKLENAGIRPEVTQGVASSCLLARLDDPCNAVCVGHALYGLSPYGEGMTKWMSGLQPVLKSISSRLIHIGDHPSGSSLTIAGEYNLDRSQRIGILPVGLSHGIQGAANGKNLYVSIGSGLSQVLAVSLEHTVIDLGNAPDCIVGDTASFVGGCDGSRLSLADLGNSWGISSLESLMRISRPGIERIWN